MEPVVNGPVRHLGLLQTFPSSRNQEITKLVLGEVGIRGSVHDTILRSITTFWLLSSGDPRLSHEVIFACDWKLKNFRFTDGLKEKLVAKKENDSIQEGLENQPAMSRR